MTLRRTRLARAIVVAVACAAVVLAAAKGGTAPDFPRGYVFSGDWKPVPAPATYRATMFPVGLRLTVSTHGWFGAQWKANRWQPDEIQKRHLTCRSNPTVCAPPYFGWVTIGKPPATRNADPRALIVILSSFSRTPTVATTAAQACHNRSFTCRPQSPVTIGGFRGVQVDGQTTGVGDHYLIPFTPPSKYAGKAAGESDGDAILISGEHPFRLTILNVRGKTVFILVGTLVLSPDQFQAFLPDADRLLASLRFPGS